MTERPRVVMLVANDVVSDTRVKKSAVTLAAAGCAVTVVGTTTALTVSETSIGAVRIVRVPARVPQRGDPVLPGWTRHLGYRTEGARRRARKRRDDGRLRSRGRQQRLDEAAARRGGLRGQVASWVLRVEGERSRLADFAVRGRERLTDGGAVPFRRLLRIDRLARRPPPGALDHLDGIESRMAGVIDAARPDVVHGHDFFTIGIARRAAERGRSRGRSVRWVYDAHEYVRGLAFFPSPRLAAATALEDEHIRHADLVVTVTDQLADRLVRDHDLARRPLVVLNAPPLSTLDTASVEGVRARLGIAAGTPLLVYSGQVKRPRGVHTLVAALVELPDVHVALVTENQGAYVDELRAQAADLGVDDRVHWVPYVAPHLVSSFVADATLGVIPLTRYGNAEVSLPNKLFEFLHAGLPVVTSDTEAMADLLARTGVGETFPAEDPSALAAAVRRVLRGPAPYRDALRASDLLARYSWERQAEVLVGGYRVLLGEGLPVPRDIPFSLLEAGTP